MRWTVVGNPRVPWEAQGFFDGVSNFKLDKHGKIYEHKVGGQQQMGQGLQTYMPLGMCVRVGLSLQACMWVGMSIVCPHTAWCACPCTSAFSSPYSTSPRLQNVSLSLVIRTPGHLM